MSTDRQLIELIDRLGNLLRAEARLHGKADSLQPVHMQTLDYLARCNRMSDTPLALSQYLGISKGTASQSIMVLYNKGLVDKVPDTRDRRVVHLHLTPAGRTCVDMLHQQTRHLNLAEVLPPAQQTELVQSLTNLLRGLIRHQDGKSFGACRTCRHFIRDKRRFHCGLIDEPLAADETEKICYEHHWPKTGTE